MIATLRRLFSRRTAGPVPLLEPMQLQQRRYEALAQSEAKLLDQIEGLDEELGQLRHQNEMLEQRCNHARAAHSAIHRQVGALRKDWPALYDRYFTKQGEADRKAGVPMNPKNRKRK